MALYVYVYYMYVVHGHCQRTAHITPPVAYMVALKAVLLLSEFILNQQLQNIFL